MQDEAGQRRQYEGDLRQDLVLDLVVGVTHQDGARAGRLKGARPSAFFAPARIREHARVGREAFAKRYGQAWRTFAPAVKGWVDVVESHGPVWLEVLSGASWPRTGHVVQL